MTLRERQKTDRRRRILDAAAALFVAQGFNAVKAEAIAAKADVSVGTVYNYFGSKNAILLTLAAVENERVADHAADYAPDADTSAAEAFRALFGIYFDPKYVILNRDLWRLAFALAFGDVTSDGARRLRDSDREQSSQVEALARHLQEAGKLRADVDCAVFGATLFNNANMLFFEFTRSETMTTVELDHRIERMTTAMVGLASNGG